MSNVLFLTIIRTFLIQEYTGKGFVLGQNIPAKIPSSCPFIGLKIPVIVPWYMHFIKIEWTFSKFETLGGGVKMNHFIASLLVRP